MSTYQTIQQSTGVEQKKGSLNQCATQKTTAGFS